jgi:hypothetical protein
MASGGLSQEQIARHFGISVPTLCKYFREELIPVDDDLSTENPSAGVSGQTQADGLSRKRRRRSR